MKLKIFLFTLLAVVSFGVIANAETVSDSVMVDVVPAVTAYIEASPNPIYSGSPTSLTWGSSYVDAEKGCSVSGGSLSSTALSGNNVSTGNLFSNTTYTISCIGGGENNTATASVTIQVNPLPPTGTLSGNDCSIAIGSSTCNTNLSWSISNPVSGASSNITKPTNITVSTLSTPSNPSSGLESVVLQYGANSFSLNHNSETLTTLSPINANCISGGWDGSKCVSAPTVSVTATPNEVNYNGSSDITWSSTNATSCTLSGGGLSAVGTLNTSGISTGNLTENTNYVVSCTGPGGNGSGSATVVVGPQNPPTVTVIADPSGIYSGQISNISWSSTNATSCADNDGNPLGGATGDFDTEALYSNTTYTIWCNGPAGTRSGSATVTVDPNPDSLMSGNLIPSSYSCTIQSGNSLCAIPFSWSTSNPVSTSEVVKNGYGTVATGNNAWNQSFNITYGSNTFVLMNNGNQLDSATVTGTTASDCDWNGTYCESNLPTSSLTASPSHIQLGNSSTLTWSSSNTTSCTGTGFDTASATSGSISVAPETTTTYTLSCSGPNGNTSSEATVDVGNGVNPTYKEF